jgi:glycosyltransferase involved in cell wall biosynthesis
MNILWHLRPRYDSPNTSGGNLRYFNFTRELQRQGHHVSFLLDDWSAGDEQFRDAFVEQIKRDLPSLDIHQFHSNWTHRRIFDSIAHKLVYPPLVNYIAYKHNKETSSQVINIIEDSSVNVFITSVTSRLWLLPLLRGKVSTVIDWCDSAVLKCTRELSFHWRKRVFRGVYPVMKELVRSQALEYYYGHVADLNLFVSPIDASNLCRSSRSSGKTKVIPNGVEPTLRPSPKVPGRMIFTGRMDYPPNHAAAMWFIDTVLPLVLLKNPKITLVIAGIEPLPELRNREGSNVKIIGYVEDMGAEISASQLYIAPLVTGSGFRNKVAEAFVNGTYVVGTPLAFEFLDREFIDLVSIGDTPHELANHILRFFDAPDSYNEQVEKLRVLACQELQWSIQTDKLIKSIREA